MAYRGPRRRFEVRREDLTEGNNRDRRDDAAHHPSARDFSSPRKDLLNREREYDSTRPPRNHCRSPFDFRLNADSTTGHRHSPWGEATKPLCKATRPAAP